jgi:hypothetical protein
MTASTASDGGDVLEYENWSAVLVALITAPTVTFTSTVVLAAPDGLLAEIWLSPLTLKQGCVPHGGSEVAPKATAVAPVKPLPRI